MASTFLASSEGSVADEIREQIKALKRELRGLDPDSLDPSEGLHLQWIIDELVRQLSWEQKAEKSRKAALRKAQVKDSYWGSFRSKPLYGASRPISDRYSKWLEKRDISLSQVLGELSAMKKDLGGPVPHGLLGKIKGPSKNGRPRKVKRTCPICGKSGLSRLDQHLRTAHQTTVSEFIEANSIPVRGFASPELVAYCDTTDQWPCKGGQ